MRKADLSKLVAGDMIVSDGNRVYYVADVYENSILVKWNFKEDEFKELKKSTLISHYEIMSEEEAIAYLDVVDALIKNNVGSEENRIEFENDREGKCAEKCIEWEIKNTVYVRNSNDQLCRACIGLYEKVCIDRVYSKKWGHVSLHQLRGYTLVDEETANELRAEAWEEHLERKKRMEELLAEQELLAKAFEIAQRVVSNN